jgi:hypothetical protein
LALIPAPVEVLDDRPELDDQHVGQIFRFHFASLFPPEAEQGGLIIAHDDPGVRAADEGATVDISV